MTAPVIDRTTPEDLPRLQDMLDATQLFPSEMLPDMVAPALRGESDDLWLTCRLGGDAIGLCYTRPEEMADRVWNMLALGIHPLHQRAGCGASLLAATEAALAQLGARLLIVETSGTDAFAPARAFYRKARFQEIARLPDYWADGDDKVTFLKRL